MQQKICVIMIMLIMTSVLAIAQPAEIQQGSKEQFTKTRQEIETFSNASPSEEWNMTFGASNIDVGYSVQQTSDGGYVIVGYTRSYGNISGHNIWLIKTDSSGNETWNRTFGGNNDDDGESVRQTTDGGYIITGHTKSFGAGGKDVILIKTNATGDEEWTQTFGGTSDDEGYNVQQASDGGYIVAGATSSFGAGSRDIWLIKTDASGSQDWTRTLGGYSSDGAWSLCQTNDGGYIITGWTFSYGPGYVGNIWLVKTDELGYEDWNKVFGGSEADRGYSVQQTSDNGYILTGYTASFGAGLDDVILIKTNASGDEEWTRTFGGSGRDYGNEVQQTSDGGYIIAGYTLSYGSGSEDVWLIKTDILGYEQYTATYGGTSSDVAYSVQQTTDGGYIIGGYTLSYGAGVHDVWLIKIVGDITYIQNISIIPNPQYANNSVNISCIIADVIAVDQALIVRTNPVGLTENISLTNNGTIYWNETLYAIIGNYTFFIWVNDTSGNTYESEIYTFLIIPDHVAPEIQDETPSIGYHNQSFTFYAIILDNAEVSLAWVTYWFDTETPVNETMNGPSNNIWMITITIPESPAMLYYFISANDTSNNSNTTDLNNVSLFDYQQSLIDVNQSMFDRGFPIRHALDGDWAAAQSFIPLLNTLTSTEIYIRKFGTPEFNLTMELRVNHPQGTLIDTLVFIPTEVPSSWTWFTLDFTDTPISSGTSYFIVCPPAPGGVTTSFGYEWGYAFGNQYDDGAFWFTRNGGGLWRDLPTMYEFCFRTYGYS